MSWQPRRKTVKLTGEQIEALIVACDLRIASEAKLCEYTPHYAHLLDVRVLLRDVKERPYDRPVSVLTDAQEKALRKHYELHADRMLEKMQEWAADLASDAMFEFSPPIDSPDEEEWERHDEAVTHAEQFLYDLLCGKIE